VYFCQDCGGANAANAETCRICGQELVRERNGAPCLRCGSATAKAANFCSKCGATTVQAVSAAQSDKGADATTGDRLVAFGQPGSQSGAELNLGEGLELPEWLKRAAAEQPFDANRQTAINANPFGPLGGSTATLDAEQGNSAAPPNAADFRLSPQAPLSAPGEEIDSLISQTAGSAGSKGIDSQASTTNASSADVTDTSTFISENDLPEWIRQLAAADEARKVEDMRRADEQSAANRAAAATDTRNRKPLPGETATSAPGTSPWLARRDRSEESETVVADSWGRPVITGEKRATTPDAGEDAVAPDPVPETVPVDPVVAAAASPTAGGQNMLRMVLLAATVLVVIAAVAFMVLS
jgi:ribosomal protein L40E